MSKNSDLLMGVPLSSEESLERLCQTQPDHPIKSGLCKIAGASGVLGIGGISGWGMYELRDMVTKAYDTIDKVLGGGIELCLGVITVGAAAYGLYLLADGVTSLGKPLGIHAGDGTVYFRNEGFTNKPSLSDKKFGSKVIPLEDVEDFGYKDCSGFVLANGIDVQETSLKSREETTMVPQTITVGNSTITTYTPVTTTYFTAVAEGKLKSRPIRAFIDTASEDLARSLAEKEKGSCIYAFGKVNQEKEIELKQFGKAFLRK